MRTLRAARELFAEYGVGATSYQMIADATGVTKGAIYHQFNTKDEITIAVAEMELATLEVHSRRPKHWTAAPRLVSCC